MSIELITVNERLNSFLTDESHKLHADPSLLKGVFYPENGKELSEIFHNLKEDGLSVTISGGRTGITGGGVPMQGGYVVSTEKMVKSEDSLEGWEEIRENTLQGEVVLQLHQELKLIRAAAGVQLNTLAELLPGDLIYPPDPTETTAAVGGTIATNASGARSFYYGATRNWVAGLEVVLPDGEFLRLRRDDVMADQDGMFAFQSESGREYQFKRPEVPTSRIKNAAGVYSEAGMDLVDLFIGSEGIFGVIAAATLRLETKPKNQISDMAFFRNTEDAIAYVNFLRDNRSRGIRSLEYFDSNSLRFINNFYGKSKGMHSSDAVFIEMEIEREEDLEWLVMVSEKFNVVEDWFADTPDEHLKLKEFRHSLPEGINSYLKQKQSSKLGTDFVVPSENFDKMYQLYQRFGRQFADKFPRDGFHFVIFGHISDMHLHMNFIAESEEERVFAGKLYLELAREAVALGGTVSGEHGVGKKTVMKGGKMRPLLELMYNEKEMREVWCLKQVFDPLLKLNKGNLIGVE